MDKEAIVFIRQLADSLDKEIENLARAKKDNDPRAFNDIKKKCFEIQKQMGDLFK